MPLLRWLATVLRATSWLAIHVVIAGGLFLASAVLYHEGADTRVPATVVRTLAAFWLYIALWTWVMRGLLMRPPPPARQEKPTSRKLRQESGGCVMNLVGVAAAWVIAGQWADWAWAGHVGGDPAHPVRRVADQGHAVFGRVLNAPDEYLPWIVGGVVGFLVLNSILGRIAAPRAMSPRQAQEAARKGRKGGQRGKPRTGASPSQIPTRSAAAVAAAHDGSHGAAKAGGAREDAVLGPLRWSSSDGGWWARQSGDQFPVRIEAGAAGPSLAQIDLARAVVQRAFEAQLRASDAARAAAQKRGVGLPRFTIVTASVGADDGPATPLTLHLRCDGDAKHQYTVRSTDALQSFVVTG